MEVANAPDDAVVPALQSIAAKVGATWDSDAPVQVVVGRDTRPSSTELAALLRRGVEMAGGTVLDLGIVTTPQTHHVVLMANRAGAQYPGLDGYVRMLSDAYQALTKGAAPLEGPLAVDCAHGVGACVVPQLNAVLPSDAQLAPFNEPDASAPERLNHGCGAEFVQKQRKPPAGVPDSAKVGRVCSLDGDADRVVYYFWTPEGKWTLLDGDAIAVLAAVFVQRQLADLGWTAVGLEQAADAPNAVRVGMVQTAYANGASTKYVRDELKLPVAVAKTGVKHVHHKATAFDLGIYFEANGHGTVLFKPELIARLQAVASDASATAAQQQAAQRLLLASQLINQAVGDALSDALFCEAALRVLGWNLADWSKLYADLPSVQNKAPVPNRAAYITNEDETRLLEPLTLQAAIDDIVSRKPGARAFVRPSGTEDVVRLYAEAPTEEAAAEVAAAVFAAIADSAA